MKKVGALVALVLVLSGCTGNVSEAQKEGQKLTEQAFEKQQKAVPYPVEQLDFSLERENLRKKLLMFNDPDKVGYVYVMNFGRFIGYYTVQGKISSTQSQMTATDLAAKLCEGCDRFVVTAPGDDGSYGDNEPGIFFFTTSGVYVSTNMDYVYVDQPMQIDVPELVK